MHLKEKWQYVIMRPRLLRKDSMDIRKVLKTAERKKNGSMKKRDGSMKKKNGKQF